MYTQCTAETNKFARESFANLLVNEDESINILKSLNDHLIFILTCAICTCNSLNLCSKDFLMGAIWMYTVLEQCEREELERIGKLSV